ncbi:MAG: GNAT family N-acetyltransferase [Anaerolineaceae bacterium]|nr:GNAT family N-acetyltransferase [Anaerolineaceae bacterium]
MNIEVRQAAYQDVEAMHELYRQEANCQIIHDSYLKRRLVDAYLIWVNDQLAGYCAVSNNDDRKRVTEFYTFPEMRSFALKMLRESLTLSQATHIEAQTNIPLMLLLLYDCAKNIAPDALLFQDAFTTHLESKNGVFRQALPEEANSIFPHHHEPVGNWVIDTDEEIVATGGFLTHYNPPYGDIYMEVMESYRQQGFGSYLVQELKRVCYEAGKKPAARCDPLNVASRRTLQKAGFLPCGYLLVGEINPTT